MARKISVGSRNDPQRRPAIKETGKEDEPGWFRSLARQRSDVGSKWILRHRHHRPIELARWWREDRPARRTLRNYKRSTRFWILIGEAVAEARMLSLFFAVAMSEAIIAYSILPVRSTVSSPSISA